MPHRLAGQVVEQIGMVVVGDVVEIDQAADHVILQPRLLDAALAQRQHFQLIGAQVLDPQLVGNRRIIQRLQVQGERLEA